jgi:hypothetical protein
MQKRGGVAKGGFMAMLARIAIVLAAAAISAMPARAATSIFPISVFSSSGTTNPGNALGAADGAAALVVSGGDIVLQYGLPLTGGGIAAAVLPLAAGANILAVSIGEVIGGIATFSGEFVIVDSGVGGVLNGDLSALCSGVSPTGCSLLRVRNAGSLFGSTGVQLDAISGVTTAPEPAVWALMILGFVGTAMRLKSVRRHQHRPRYGRIFRFHRRLAV